MKSKKIELEREKQPDKPSEKHSFCKTKTKREARRIKHEAAKKNMDKHWLQ
jgi:hypothetical protein